MTRPYPPTRLGDAVPWHFLPAIVAASYFASLCGTVLTVEILHRRGTGVRNWRSWLETLSCAVSMGLIGIWCMHFIGNRAIAMDDGRPTLQLVYNPGFNTLSVFLPIIGLTIAFSVAEFPSKSPLLHWALLACTGVFAGLSIVGMHYMGNFGVTNYEIIYNSRYLIASILIAIGDCLGVLAIFYTWRDMWITSWWKRLLCAALLSGGVTSMHFTASTGCEYILKHQTTPGAIKARNIQVEVAGALCAAAAVSVLGVLCLTQYRTNKLKRSAQKVMLACAVFDPDGKVLVTTDGALPAREITNQYHHRSFSEEFDTSHPVFQWIFRVTRNWSAVSGLVPRFKSHLGVLRDEQASDSQPGSSSSSVVYDPETYNDYSIIFREQFCVAAASLASSMALSLEKLGILYDGIVETGVLPSERCRRNTLPDSSSVQDLEMAFRPRLFGKGQLLFLVRRATSEESDKLLNAGYKFAGLQHVGRTIANMMQIPLVTFDHHAAALRQFLHNTEEPQKLGTWLTLFTLIGRPHGRGFDVVVKRKDQSQLPDVPLLPYWPEQWQIEFLKRLDGLGPNDCETLLEEKLLRVGRCDPGEGHLASSMLQAIRQLSLQVPEPWLRESRFSATTVYAHYCQEGQGKAVPVVLYTFIAIADPHDSCSVQQGVTQVPLAFFSARQRVYMGSPDHMALTRSIHQEFSPVLARAASKRNTTSLKSPLHKVVSANGSSRSNSTDNASDVQLEDRASARNTLFDTLGGNRDSTWGGIIVNTETVVQTSVDEQDRQSRPDLGMSTGIKTACGTAKAEVTFVDELMAIARARLTNMNRAYAPR